MLIGQTSGYGVRGPRWGRRILFVLGLAATLAVAYVVFELSRALPPLAVNALAPGQVAVAGAPARLPWPKGGSGAVEVLGVGPLGASRGEKVVPLASITKLMTALVVLKRHPLAMGDTGPVVPITTGDVAAYHADLASGQSVLEVRAGERLTELQALEGLLIPSANNIADVLARWTSGSSRAFVAQMNAMAATLGLRHTHFVEPSGIEAGDAGSALDMMRLGADALADPTIAAIVGLGEVDLPVAGIVINYDYAVGHHGIIGIKTGSSSAAGGNFVFAARRRVDGRRLTVVGAVLGQRGFSQLDTALAAGQRLAAAAFTAVRPFIVLPGHLDVVRVSAPWLDRALVARTTTQVSFFGVPGGRVQLRTLLNPALMHSHTISAGEQLATIEVTFDGHHYARPVTAPESLPGPSLSYRLRRF